MIAACECSPTPTAIEPLSHIVGLRQERKWRPDRRSREGERVRRGVLRAYGSISHDLSKVLVSIGQLELRKRETS